eukprot:TRINITY_DN644_c0_g1_i1.p1 TRINITY_DN644_c0_g1~~TRINITY_DN644_c0_g1_i1.p1  ORF type:complete len:437 (+),score=219.60 TRINITY_DN644_c0_g1_i1:59-1369(+)
MPDGQPEPAAAVPVAAAPVAAAAPPPASSSNLGNSKEKLNWLIHLLYTRHNHKLCLMLVEEQLEECRGLCEYAIYIKALIKRANGELQESMTLFQAATVLNPHNVQNLKQVGRSLYLLGKHRAAIGIFEETSNYSEEDWEVSHNMGLCYLYLKNYAKAEESFIKANVIQRHDSTYLQLGKLYTLQDKYHEAIDIYLEALDYSPENPELLTTVGLLYLRLSENFKAFDYLGNSLTHDPKNPKTILAAGSIIQDHSDMDVALTKYRIAAVQTPNSAQLWNNIGMCFFGKQFYIAAISCLRRALYLAPFEWIIAYNLGLVYLNTQQYASAFHFFSASINLKQDFSSSYMYLAITLNRLDDFDNACSAYEKGISMERDHLFELNYAVTLYNQDEMDQARQHFMDFEEIFNELDDETRQSDEDVLNVRNQLQQVFGVRGEG